jgi:Uma2 family endonuclease
VNPDKEMLMSSTTTLSSPAVVYPESDGKPMADNTRQGRWIVLLYTGVAGLFRPDEDVLVAPNVNWYPVEGEEKIVNAPDVLVAFGRPQGDRTSYKQWEEGGVAPQVVFEVLSPGNTVPEMAEKLQFYDDHGVEEYYVYDPELNDLLVYVRGRMTLRLVRPSHGFVSPRLKIRFDLSGDEMVVFGPDGRRFLTPHEIADVRSRAERLAELGRKLRAGQASEEELREFDRLTAPPPS